MLSNLMTGKVFTEMSMSPSPATCRKRAERNFIYDLCQHRSCWGEAHTPFVHWLLCLHEHCTCAVVLKATGHDKNSVFGAEFVAKKIEMKSLRGLRYKLPMLGVGISGPSYVFGNNMSVIHNRGHAEKEEQLNLLPRRLQVSCNGGIPHRAHWDK